MLLFACGPSQEEIDALLAEQEKRLTHSFRQTLVNQGVMPTQAERDAAAERERNKADWERSMDFLADLDELMSDYVPDLPSLVGSFLLLLQAFLL